MKKLISIIVTSFIFNMSPTRAQVIPNHKIIVYQIVNRLFSNSNTTNTFYGTKDQNGCGKFNDINDKALKSIKDLGITHVWYTGIIEHATLTDYTKFGINKDHPQVVKGIAGSPYAIKDYYDVDPDLATNVDERMAEFESLLLRSHKNDLKVLIDFIPNHVARQYSSDVKPENVFDFGAEDNKMKEFDPQNNFYYIPRESFKVPSNLNTPIHFDANYSENPAKATGNDVFSASPSINDWFETVKLNYGVDYLNNRQTHFESIPDTWLKMEHILQYWAQKGVDGFRCDMAEMVPVEFWAWVIPQIKKKHPGVIFIAEIYNPQQYSNYIFTGKFDYLYDKVGLYDALRRLIEGHGNANDISKVWQNESGDFSEHMLRFLENHDEQRIASEYFGKNAESALPAMMLSATLHTGPLMLYFGQELGVKPTQAEGFQGEDGRTSIFDYWGLPEMQAWIANFNAKELPKEQKIIRDYYKKIITFAKDNDIVKYGGFYDLQYLNQNNTVYNSKSNYSYLRYYKNKALLFVYNFDNKNSSEIRIKLPEDFLKNELKLKTKNELIFNNIFESKEIIKTNLEKIIESNDINNGLKLKLKANSFKIFEITYE